jgi:hypothetical protein
MTLSAKTAISASGVLRNGRTFAYYWTTPLSPGRARGAVSRWVREALKEDGIKGGSTIVELTVSTRLVAKGDPR